MKRAGDETCLREVLTDVSMVDCAKMRTSDGAAPPPGAGGDGGDGFMPPSLAERVAAREERFRRAHSAAAEAIVLPPAERRDFVAGHPDCLCPEFVELMIAMARERRGEEPRDSVRCAHLAVTAIEAYAGAGGRDGDDVRALAWAELGNAHRICGDLRSAGMAFHHARQRVRDAADPLVRAEVYQIEAAYRDYTCEFERAIRLLRRAERLQVRFGSPNSIALTRILRAEPARRTGRLIEAIDLLQSAVGLLDVRSQPRLALVAVHNLATCLIDAGAFDAALGILRRFQPAYEAFGGPRDRALRALLEARAVRAAGLYSLAEAILLEVRERFVELENPYEVVTADLELAEVYATEHRWPELEAIAGEMLELCTMYGVGAEVLASAKLLCDAAQGRQATAESVLGLLTNLRRRLAP